MNVNTIRSAYENVLKKFDDAVSDSNLTFKRPTSTGFVCKSVGQNKVEVSFLLRLPNWPFRNGSKKTVDIVLMSSEVFDCNSKKSISSKVKIKFLNSSQAKKIIPVLDLHYDYEDKEAHPIFHAQFGTIDMNEVQLKELNFDSKLEKAEQDFYSSLRIPTPYMNITSVLLSLAADHLKPTSYKIFLKGVRDSHVIKWDVTCNKLETHLKAQGNVHSHGWYPD